MLAEKNLSLQFKMPVEDMEEQGLAKIPDLGIAQLKFQLQHLKYESNAAYNQVKNYFSMKLNVLCFARDF